MTFFILVRKEWKQTIPWIVAAWLFLAVLTLMAYQSNVSHYAATSNWRDFYLMPDMVQRFETLYPLMAVALCSLIYADQGMLDLVTASKMQVSGSFLAKAASIWSVCSLGFLTAAPICICLGYYPLRYLPITLSSGVITLLFYCAVAVFLRVLLKSVYLPFVLLALYSAMLNIVNATVLKRTPWLGCISPIYDIWFPSYFYTPSIVVWIFNRLIFLTLSAVLLFGTHRMLKRNRLSA